MNYRDLWPDPLEQELMETIATNGTNKYKTERLHKYTEESLRQRIKFSKFIGFDGGITLEEISDMKGLGKYVMEWAESRRYCVFYKKANGKSHLFQYNRIKQINVDWTKPLTPTHLEPKELNIEVYEECSFDGKGLLHIMKLLEKFMEADPELKFYVMDWTILKHVLVHIYQPMLNGWRKTVRRKNKAPYPPGWEIDLQVIDHYRIIAAVGSKGAWRMRPNYYVTLKQHQSKEWPEKCHVVREKTANEAA